MRGVYVKDKKRNALPGDVSIQPKFLMDNLSSSILMVTKILLVWNWSLEEEEAWYSKKKSISSFQIRQICVQALTLPFSSCVS